MGSATTLTADDATAIAKQVSYIEAVAPTQRANTQVIAGDSNMNSSITGVTPDYQQVLGLEIADGNFFSQNQYDSASKVAVLGYTAKDNLFGDSDAVGEQIRVGNGQFKVIGTLKEKGTSMLANTDTAIFIPLTTLRQTVNATRTSSGAYTVNQIIVSLTDRKYSAAAIADMTSLLETRHRITAGADDDFSITSQEDIVATITKASGSMTMLLGAIAAISLLVGGIGVMNIMLVSVIERTREIGIRKALGAHERDIWMQFLIEAGIGGTATVVSADIIILAISVSIAIGVFFGFYPAWQASRLNPIDALRSE
jgi:putative ABC transport system permease protein